MASSPDRVDYIAAQLGGAGEITTKPMFGEYGIYCDGKFIGVICRDTLYLKSTKPGLDYGGDQLAQAPAYAGAKPSLAITDAQLENIDWLTELVKITYNALPAPKAKQ